MSSLQTFSGWCGVRYYEYDSMEPVDHHGDYMGLNAYDKGRGGIHGEFQEHVELDREGGKFEKIDVPEFAECKRATILHDFDQVCTEYVFTCTVY